MKIKDTAIAGIILVVILLIILPIPTGLLDVLLVINISLSLMVLTEPTWIS